MVGAVTLRDGLGIDDILAFSRAGRMATWTAMG